MGSFFDGGFSILGSAFNAIGQLAANNANKRENARNRQFSMQEAEKAYQRERTLIREQNEYNSPVAIRQRMEEAGLNPFVTDASSYQSSTSTNAPQATPTGSNSYSPVQIDPMTLANIKLAQAETNKTNAEADSIDEATRGQSLQNTWQEMQNEVYKEFGKISQQLDISHKELTNVLSSVSVDLQNLDVKLKEFDLNTMKPKEAALLVARTQVEQTSKELNEILKTKHGFDMYMSLQEFGLRQALANSTIRLNNSQISLNKSVTDLNDVNYLTAYEQYRNEKYKADYNQRLGDEVYGTYIEALKNQYILYLKHTNWMLDNQSSSNQFIRGLLHSLDVGGKILPGFSGTGLFDAPTSPFPIK